MRKATQLLVAVLSIGLAGTANAAILNWEGTAQLVLGDFGTSSFARGGVATINSPPSGIPTGTPAGSHIDTLRIAASRGNITATFTLFVTDPDSESNSIAKLTFLGISFGTGTFAPISGALTGPSTAGLTQTTMPVRGIVRFCLINNSCPLTGQLVLTYTTPTTVDPRGTLGVGLGGLITLTVLNAATISVEGAPWTIKTRTVIDHTTNTAKTAQGFQQVQFKGFAHSVASGTTNTGSTQGLVQLITPAQAATNLPAGSNKKVAAGITWVITFIPEPGLLLLLGSGVVGLGLLGRQRMKK